MTATGTEEQFPHEADPLVSEIFQMKSAMQTAMSAIGENDLATFEQSIQEQEALCAHLNSLLRPGNHNLPPAAIPMVQAAMLSTRDLSRSYLHLIEQARANSEQLRRLCLAYNQ